MPDSAKPVDSDARAGNSRIDSRGIRSPRGHGLMDGAIKLWQWRKSTEIELGEYQQLGEPNANPLLG